MPIFCFLFLESDEMPVVVSGGKISFKKAKKVIKDNQRKSPENVIKKISFKDRTINVRDINMITIYDPTEKSPVKVHVKAKFTNGLVERIPIKFKEFKELMDINDKSLLYETRFVEDNWTIVRKNSIVEYENV